TLVLDELEDLITQRQRTYTLAANPQAMTSWYARNIDYLVSIAESVSLITDDATLARELRAYQTLDTLVEAIQEERIINERIIRQGYFEVDEADTSRRQAVTSDLALEDAQEAAAVLDDGVVVPGFGASLGAVGD